MAKKNSTKTATKEALQASEPRVQTFSQWGGMYIKESPYGWTTDYEFERHGHVQNQTDLKPNFLMIQDNVISTSTKSLETRNETQLVSTAPHGLSFTGVTCLTGDTLYAAFNDGSIRYFLLKDAPNIEPADGNNSKWTMLSVTDADNPDEVVIRNWKSINFFNGQLVCFTEDEQGVGEIFSGIPSTGIASAVKIPDPRKNEHNQNDQLPYVEDMVTWGTFYDEHTGFGEWVPGDHTRPSGFPGKDPDAYVFIREYPMAIISTYQPVTSTSGNPGITNGAALNTLYGYAREDYPNNTLHFYRDPRGYDDDLYTTEDFRLDSYYYYDQTIAYDISTGKIYVADADSEAGYYYHLREMSTDFDGNPWIKLELPHRLQFCYTYSNKFGQTLGSDWRTVYSNISPQLWSAKTGGANISFLTPNPEDWFLPDPEHPGQDIPDYPGISDFNITGIDIYYTKDDAYDMVFLGHISQTQNSEHNINSFIPDSVWAYSWWGASSDISEWSNVSLTTPTENTTKGVDAAYMNVHDGRCYFFGGLQKYRLWIGGRVGSELSIATGVGGGYIDIEPGSGMIVNNTHKFKTYNGANIVTIMCGHSNTHQVRRFNLVQTNIALTNELSASGWMTEEVSNVVGCLSHHGSGVWAQGLYTLSRYGLALTTQQMENSNNLRAQLVSDAIQPIFTESLASALNNTQMIFVDDVVYFALSKGPQYLNCGLIGQVYNTQTQYYVRNNDTYIESNPESESEYYENIYTFYVKEAVLDDIIFAYDVNSQAWYTFTYQPNLLDSSINDFGPDTPQDAGYPSAPNVGDIIHCTVDDTYWRYTRPFAGAYMVTTSEDDNYTWVANVVPHPINNFPCYSQGELTYHLTDASTGILSLINFDSQSSPEGIGIVTTDRIEMIPTAGVIDNAPSYNSSGDIEVPNFIAHIETGELSTSSPPQQFHTLSQLEFRFDYFFGDIDIDIEGVDYYGRTFHIHKDVTYDEIQQDLAVYVRVDYIVNTYNIKIKGRAHFRLTHVMAKVYPESRKINLVYGFDDSSLYKKRHGGTQFTHHYIKDYNNLRRALEP